VTGFHARLGHPAHRSRRCPLYAAALKNKVAKWIIGSGHEKSLRLNAAGGDYETVDVVSCLKLNSTKKTEQSGQGKKHQPVSLDEFVTC